MKFYALLVGVFIGYVLLGVLGFSSSLVGWIFIVVLLICGIVADSKDK